MSGVEIRKLVSFIEDTLVEGGRTAPVPVRTHKRDGMKGTRSHFLTLEFSIADAPRSNEIVIAVAAANGGRPHHRIGDRFKDMDEMGVDHADRPLNRVRLKQVAQARPKNRRDRPRGST